VVARFFSFSLIHSASTLFFLRGTPAHFRAPGFFADASPFFLMGRRSFLTRQGPAVSTESPSFLSPLFLPMLPEKRQFPRGVGPPRLSPRSNFPFFFRGLPPFSVSACARLFLMCPPPLSGLQRTSPPKPPFCCEVVISLGAPAAGPLLHRCCEFT